MRYIVIVILIVLVNIKCESQDSLFSKYAINTWQVLKDKNFFLNKKKFLIPNEFLISNLIKDSAEIGRFYEMPAMDDTSVIISGYQKNYFYNYCIYNFDNQKHFALFYIKQEEDNLKVYVSVFNKFGNSVDELLISGEQMDQLFFDSRLDDNLNVQMVTYSYINENSTNILIQDYHFNNKTEKFEIGASNVLKTSKFYYDFKSHKIEEDPLYLP